MVTLYDEIPWQQLPFPDMDPLVEGAWIAAGATLLGVGGTVIVAIAGFRSTRNATTAAINASREDRLHDKRADAYIDALLLFSYLADLRATMRRVLSDPHRLPMGAG